MILCLFEKKYRRQTFFWQRYSLSYYHIFLYLLYPFSNPGEIQMYVNYPWLQINMQISDTSGLYILEEKKIFLQCRIPKRIHQSIQLLLLLAQGAVSVVVGRVVRNILLPEYCLDGNPIHLVHGAEDR